jgi:hypothetical protein
LTILYVFDKGQKRYIAIEIHQTRIGLANCAFECNPRFAIPDEGENDTEELLIFTLNNNHLLTTIFHNSRNI